MKPIPSLIISSCLAVFLLSSCAVPGNPLEMLLPFAGIGNGSYDSQPGYNNRNAYVNGRRRYSEGHYEQGTYYYRGQVYSSRYYQDGRYYYGGSEQYLRGGARNQDRQYNRTQYGPTLRQSRFY